VTLDEALARLRAMARPGAVLDMARVGLRPRNALDLSVPQLRRLARKIGRDHRLARELWATGIHDARVLAAMIEEPSQVTERQCERWVRAFDSWGLCDACCLEVFCKLPFAHRKAVAWTRRREEYVRRAGFALMAVLAVHDKAATDAAFRRLLPVIERGAADERNFVKKAVSWALRQIGKRSRPLQGAAIASAERIARLDSRAARWVAADVLRELRSDAVRRRLDRRVDV
jgi:3-methyladenine DNA glycosylase AlkD